MIDATLDAVGASLYTALNNKIVIDAPSARVNRLDLDGAYYVSETFLTRRLAHGEKLIGFKLGITSFTAQNALGIREPIFGYLTDTMEIGSLLPLPVIAVGVQPRIEGEIAFRLHRDLVGPEITEDDVLRATDAIFPCLEIIDTRIENWNLSVEDAVADNACGGSFILGAPRAPEDFDFAHCHVRMSRSEESIAAGTGAEAMGSPLKCVAWLANTLSKQGKALRAGHTILAGALVPAVELSAGDNFRIEIEGLGHAEVAFC